MSISTCPRCCSEIDWDWDDAFQKFGFNDGDGIVMTEHVARVLRDAGYVVTVEAWGLHNVVIASILDAGIEQIPEDYDYVDDDPRDHLPKKIVTLLDQAFTSTTEVSL